MTKKEQRQLAGRKGGAAVLRKMGRGYFAELGARGGRPRLETLAEIKSRMARAQEEINTKKKGMNTRLYE